jgi:hypothetical protein
MPAESILFLTLVVVGFFAFGLTLAWAQRSSTR